MTEATICSYRLKWKFSQIWEIGHMVQNVGDFNDENALKVAVKILCCASNSISRVSMYSLVIFTFVIKTT